MRRLIGLCVTVLSIAVLPSAALAQAVITGAVKDTSGAVLPGVTVKLESSDSDETLGKQSITVSRTNPGPSGA